MYPYPYLVNVALPCKVYHQVLFSDNSVMVFY